MAADNGTVHRFELRPFDDFGMQHAANSRMPARELENRRFGEVNQSAMVLLNTGQLKRD